MAIACNAELISAVSSPPTRSATKPQICRLTSPAPSSTDSIMAPRLAEMP